MEFVLRKVQGHHGKKSDDTDCHIFPLPIMFVQSCQKSTCAKGSVLQNQRNLVLYLLNMFTFFCIRDKK